MPTDEDYSEDWTKVSTWDVRNPDGTLVEDMDQLLAVLPGTHSDPYGVVKHFSTLPAWIAAPDKIKAEFEDMRERNGDV